MPRFGRAEVQAILWLGTGDAFRSMTHKGNTMTLHRSDNVSRFTGPA